MALTAVDILRRDRLMLKDEIKIISEKWGRGQSENTYC